MAEWLKALVLKTKVGFYHREFESHFILDTVTKVTAFVQEKRDFNPHPSILEIDAIVF